VSRGESGMLLPVEISVVDDHGLDLCRTKLKSTADVVVGRPGGFPWNAIYTSPIIMELRGWELQSTYFSPTLKKPGSLPIAAMLTDVRCVAHAIEPGDELSTCRLRWLSENVASGKTAQIWIRNKKSF
jgi:hypothetical protein